MNKLTQDWMVWLVLIFGGPCFGSCSKQSTQPAPPTELRVHFSTEPASVDPSLAEDGASLKILGNTAEGLVGINGAGQLVGRLASGWKVSPNGLNYEFLLREDAFWSDGVALQADDFKTGIERTLHPKTGAKLAELLGSIASISAPEGRKLLITLKKKTPYFIQVLSLPIASPQRRDILEKNGGKWPLLAPSASAYYIAERKPDQHWLLKSNPFYKNEKARPSQVRLVQVSDETSALALFEQGQLDLLGRIPPLEQEALQKKGLLFVKPFWATFYLGFNTQKKPFDQPTVRCALAKKVMKAEIVAALGSGETVAESWVPPGMEGYFQESVWSASDSQVVFPAGLRVRAGFDSNSRNSMIMEKVQSDWKKSTTQIPSVEVELFNQDWKTYLRELKLNPPDVFRFGWLAAFADPISHLQALTSGNPNNLTGWKNVQYDALVSEIESLEPGSARERKIIEAQKLLIGKECVVIPIYHYVQVQGVSPRVKDFQVNGLGVVRWSELVLK